MQRRSRQPALPVRAHEGVVVEMRVGGADPVDLFLLARSQGLVRVEAPDAREKPLPAQDLVAAGDDAVEVIRDVEDRRVAVGDLRVERQEIGRHVVGGVGGLDTLEQRDRLLDPHAPMSEQAALDAQHRLAAVRADDERRDQVEDDVVVVAAIERDAVGGAGLDHAAHDVEGAVAVERRDLDRDDVLDGREAAPERHRQHQPADGGLQIEADQRNLARDRLGVRDQLVLARALERGKRQEPRVVAEAARRLRLAHRLRRAAGETRDHDQRTARPLHSAAHREREHGLVEPDVADGELGGVHADGEAAGAGIEVVARQRPLATGVEPALRIERERVRGDHHAPAQGREHLVGPILPAQRHLDSRRVP